VSAGLQSFPLLAAACDARARADAAHRSLLSEIAALVGIEAAQRLVDNFAGRRVYVARAPAPGDHLARAVGMSAALRLAAVFGGERIPIPADPDRAQRRERILMLRRRRLSVSTIARALHVTERYVYKVLADAREPAAPRHFPSAQTPVR
jgi:Homeodomain-like domain